MITIDNIEKLSQCFINKFFEEIQYLKEAEKLLEQVYLDIGSYNTRGVTFETSKKINDHFKFNDSE